MQRSVILACALFLGMPTAAGQAVGADRPGAKRDRGAARQPGPAKGERSYLETGGERELDVVYKQVGKRALKLDLYYPTGKRDTRPPVIIYTHGGGWAAGSRFSVSKRLFAPLFMRLLAEGFCVASVDYRLARKGTGVAMRDCVIDAKDAVRYLAKNAGALKIDAERFYVMGDSAGGQIAQLLLLSPAESLIGDPALADVPFVIRAGLVWYAPVDFEDQSLFNHDDRPDFVDRFRARITPEEVSPEERLRRYREMSPVQYLAGDSPPLLMIQGDRDTTIPVKPRVSHATSS